MKISKIRSFSRNYPHVKLNSKFYFAIKLSGLSSTSNKLLGFDKTMPSIGSKFLPPKEFGSTCKFNADGMEIPNRKTNKETIYIPVKWKWYQWKGRYEREEKEEVRYRGVKRWKRTIIPPPSIELQVLKDVKGESFLLSPLQNNSVSENSKLCHIANIFREINKNHIILEENLNQIIKANIINLNWNVLPKGQMPWNKLQNHLNQILKNKSPNQKYVINYRFESINSYNPDFLAIGSMGFHGYVIFGFTTKNLYVLESIHKDNATYVFIKNWQVLSKKTKAEILNKSLHKKRIIHRKEWRTEIDSILK